MIARELIEMLKQVPEDTEILCTSDSEWNQIRRATNAIVQIKEDYDGWQIDCYDPEWSAGDAGMEADEWQEFKSQAKKVIVII